MRIRRFAAKEIGATATTFSGNPRARSDGSGTHFWSKSDHAFWQPTGKERRFGVKFLSNSNHFFGNPLERGEGSGTHFLRTFDHFWSSSRGGSEGSVPNLSTFLCNSLARGEGSGTHFRSKFDHMLCHLGKPILSVSPETSSKLCQI